MTAETARIPHLDIARSAAILAMVVYHTAFDLEMFGWLAPGTAFAQPLRGLAIATASSFLALAGISLVLAHGRGIRWPGFWRRFAKIAGAAALISIATYIWAPQQFIYFGILHAIAALSLLGLLALRWAIPALVAAAAIALAAPVILTPMLAQLALAGPEFAGSGPAWLAWTGLIRPVPPALDFVPLLPWAAPFLAGMALARIGEATGLWHRLAAAPALPAALAWPGRHALVIYLVHQPILIALIWAGTALLR
ncbi:MAG: heparan-alpha-glucosaminide N-acetyltransferase [Pseudomonadota bacterium]